MRALTRAELLKLGLSTGVTFVVSKVSTANQDDDNAMIALAHQSVRREVLGTSTDAVTGSTPSCGVFVTIERDGRVIGCRGTLTARYRTRDEEIVAAARAAAGHDPRYRPLTPNDLKDFQVTVTLIDRLVRIDLRQVADLTPADGLVLTSGTRTGVVLPWEGRDAATRLGWAYRKAGVAEGSACTLQRMFARRFCG